MILHHYVIVREDLPLGTLGAQLIHAAGESVVEPVPKGTYAICLSVPNEAALERTEQCLQENDVPHVAVREPDKPWCGAIMTIGIRPMSATNPNLRRVVKRLPLLKEKTMNITKEIIDTTKLVDTIHTIEAAQCSGTWAIYAKENGIGRQISKWFFPTSYSTYATGLYTLRAWLRGKLHRKNPPEKIRDFNRTVQERDLKYKLKEWDATEHNKKIAEEFAAGFFREEGEEAATG